MEHLLAREIAAAVYLLLLGAARCHFASSFRRSADRASAALNRARQVPAYVASAAWAIYVTWLIIAPARLDEWDRWSLNHWLADFLSWTAIPFFGAGLWLFWTSHATIGRYWSIRIQLKEAHRLVTDGPYRFIRHPLYTSLFLGYLGTLLALQSWVLAVWFPAFVAAYLLFADEEETVMERGFGDAYRAYRRDTGMFLPKWRSARAALSPRALRRRARGLEVPADGSDD
jgi:protein-S-isoprenylcysteine O-methyltransferase Ste14